MATCCWECVASTEAWQRAPRSSVVARGPVRVEPGPPTRQEGPCPRRSDQPLEPGYNADLAVPGKQFRRSHGFDRTLSGRRTCLDRVQGG
jgi:hypothetical protein